jgi:glycosyltransferase involved in cell wall biosynthesis
MVRHKKSVMLVGRAGNTGSYFNFLKVIREIVFFCKKESIGVLHLFGSEKVGYLSGILKFFLKDTKVIWTSNVAKFPAPSKKVLNKLLGNVDLFVTSTQFMKKQAEGVQCNKAVLQHGILREFQLPEQLKVADRVLFWRDPSYDNGADLCAETYRILAPKYPNIKFNFAIRPHWNEEQAVQEVEKDFSNVSIYRFPYSDGITIESLLSETLVCLFPFRRLSINPQWAILETLKSGIPVIASDVSSNAEIMGDNNLLLSALSVEELVRSIEFYLNGNVPKNNAAEDYLSVWNWAEYYSELMKHYKVL